MALDAAVIAALREELSRELTDGKIEKIQQPEKDLLLFTLRASGETRRLLIRAAGPNARVHLTERSFENPATAPMFCMLLRKYLTGARIRGVEQPNGDRLLAFTLESRNDLGDTASFRLMTELMGRAANVILVGPDGRIVDCLRRIPLSEHGTRALLPGLRYELPPRPEGFLVKQGDSSAASFAAAGENPAGVSAALDARFGAEEQQELQRRRAQELVKTVRRARDRQQRKLAVQLEELRRTEQTETIRREAELLQANLYRVRRGDRVLECENYYEENLPLQRIALDPLCTPQENLAAYFKRYRKLKGAKEHLTVLIAEGEKQLDYLNSVLEELDRAESARELEEIRRELTATGWLKAPRQKPKPLKSAAPLRFESEDGFEILVGRNNLQNDELTLHTARRTDYWLHVKNLHGSHVILRCEDRKPSETALEDAARIAARFSQARGQGKTAVDCTMVRNVKKPSGSLPGRVIYDNYRTLIVDSGPAAGKEP